MWKPRRILRASWEANNNNNKRRRWIITVSYKYYFVLESMRPRHLKPRPARASRAWDSQSPCHLNVFSLRLENVQRNELQLHTFFNYAINIFGELYTPAALHSRKYPCTHGIRACVRLEDTASCVLSFSSVITFWHVFFCQLRC